MTAINRTAYPRLADSMSGRELVEAFTPTAEELSWAADRTHDDRNRLGLLVLLKAYQRLGYFPDIDEVPAVAFDQVRASAGLGADIEPAYSQRTIEHHRKYIRSRQGLEHRRSEIRKIAAEAIETAARTKDNPADLINVALEELVRSRCELPGYSTLDEMTARIRTRVNTAVFAAVAGRIDPIAQGRLTRLLTVDPATRRSELDTLKDPPPAPSLRKFKARIEHLRRLDTIGDTGAWMADVPAQKVGHFAGEARALVVSDLRKVGTEKQLTLIASLLHEHRAAVRDQVTEMFCKRIAALHKSGRDQLEKLREAHRAESERLLGVFRGVLDAAQEAAEETADPADLELLCQATGAAVLDVLAAGGGIDGLTASHEQVAAHHGNNYLPLLEGFFKSHRPVLFTLLDALELEATTAETAVLDAVAFLKANRHRIGAHVPETAVIDHEDGTQTILKCDVDAFASGDWKKILRDKHQPGKLVRRHLEICIFSYLAAELRSGDIAVVGADSYANLHDQLMDWDECRSLAEEFCDQAGLPATGAELVAHFQHELTAAAERVDAGYPANTDLSVDGGRPVLKRRKGKERRASAIALEAALHERMPERALLDVVTRSAHEVGWHRHLGPASGSDPKIPDTLGRYAVTTFAYGTLLGPTQVARHMRGQVSASEIYTAGNKHATATKVERCSADVVNRYMKLDLSRVYGDETVVGADGSQIDTWEDSLLAESHIRYGGYGGIAYRHVSDTYIAVFSHFIPCGVWEAVYIIEGLLKNQSDLEPTTIHGDTQAQSLPVFGLAALMGFDLLPRIRNWKDVVLYRPDRATRYAHIDTLFGDEAIDWSLIQTHWPDLLRTAISIREGRLSSVTLLRRLGVNSRKNRLYRAFRELGRVIRTITILRFLSEPELREQIDVMTNKVESFHNFSDWLSFGADLIGHNDPVQQEKIVKFNELLANIVTYSNACDITVAANQLAAEGYPVDPEDLATVSPYITENVRRFGDYVLDLTPPESEPDTRLDLVPGALFPPSA
ncbi:Tn3 family transposase [Glycomyces buryatensis]|uniref:Tn3 family transposase n=1 Tax=Glycomyces buryatensis TaxID=2570927 RepID=A0A4S8QDN8_9ACTN|nr:Tn3 family transposase [Glycomyces buryatensis]THV42673.1 Tn3 family transposase [Glycomyces buryatensis]